MNKESIYKLIGYNGEYNNSVKKAIRKLLKDNHPDKNGDSNIFSLINEVKEELENNKVSYNFKKSTNTAHKYEDIDYDYCYKMIEKITREKNIYAKTLSNKEEKLSNYIEEYKDCYQKSIDLENILLNNSVYMNKLKNNRAICVFLLVLAFIVFGVSVWKKSIILFSIFTLIVIICVVTIYKTFYIIRNMSDNNRIRIKKYVGVNTKLRDNQSNQEKLKKEINDLNKRINNLDNDLRFYNNLFNNR